MKVVLDEYGVVLRDVEIPESVRSCLAHNADIHTSQVLVIMFLRAELLELYPDYRPPIDWQFYGRTVIFDADLRSNEAFLDPRERIWDDCLHRIICPRRK